MNAKSKYFAHHGMQTIDMQKNDLENCRNSYPNEWVHIYAILC